MAPGADRPPSQQGVEYQVLDAVADLSRRVDELAQRPAVVLPAHANWWDVLPNLGYPGASPWSEILYAGGTSWLQLNSTQPSYNVVLRVVTLADRLELSLQLNSGQIIWQRALFFERPAA